MRLANNHSSAVNEMNIAVGRGIQRKPKIKNIPVVTGVKIARLHCRTCG